MPIIEEQEVTALVQYYDSHQTLTLYFKNGTSDTYADVPLKTFHSLTSADSKGYFFQPRLPAPEEYTSTFSGFESKK